VKIRVVGAELFHEDRRTHKYEEANSSIFSILLTRLKMQLAPHSKCVTSALQSSTC